MRRPISPIFLLFLSLPLGLPGPDVSAQHDSARLLFQLDGRAPAFPFGSITDVGVAEHLGRIYVLDAMNGEVAVFSNDGRPLFHVGRVGQGPGEISSLARSLVVWENGSFGVADLGNQRMSRWDSSGTFIGDWPLLLEDGHPIKWSALEGGLIAEITPSAIQVMEGGPAHNRLVRLGLDGSNPETIHTFEEVSPLLSLNRSGAPIARPLMETSIWAADSKGRVLVGRSGKYQVADISGVSEFRVSREIPVRPVTSRMKDRIRAGFDEAVAGKGLPVPEIEFPEHLPVMGGIVCTGSGAVLIRQREMDDHGSDRADMAGSLWDVFSESGSYLKSLRLPAGFVLEGLMGGAFVGWVRDEFDVPSIRVLEQATQGLGRPLER